MIQNKVYFVKRNTNEVMSLPIQPLKFYNTAFSAGWKRCSLKEYKRGLTLRKLLTGSYQLQKGL